MGGAGLGAAFILHQAGIDQFNLFGGGRRLSVGVQLTAVLAIHAEQGVGLAFDPVQSELVVEIDLGVGVEILVVGVAFGLGDVQNLIGFVQQEIAVALVVQMGFRRSPTVPDRPDNRCPAWSPPVSQANAASAIRVPAEASHKGWLTDCGLGWRASSLSLGTLPGVRSSMALKLSLKPGEKFVLNGAVVQNGDRRGVLILQNRASVLREKDIMQAEDVTTPARRIYFPIMMMYLDESGAAKFYDELALRITEFMGATQNPDILAECVSASRHVLAREYYKALMSARKIVEYEERVLNVASGLHSGDGEG